MHLSGCELRRRTERTYYSRDMQLRRLTGGRYLPIGGQMRGASIDRSAWIRSLR